jgi:hypothetical protein
VSIENGGKQAVDVLTVGVLQKELEYRRKKQWDIFSWCSTVLLAMIGGIFALATGPSLGCPCHGKGVWRPISQAVL